MIVGDCVVTEDDNLWQSKEFEQLTDTGSTVSIPWFDPPLINPQPAVCAVPVSIQALDLAFQHVFGKPYEIIGGSLDTLVADKATTGIVTTRKKMSSLRSTTPLCGSSFSVLTYSTSEHICPQPNDRFYTYSQQVSDSEKGNLQQQPEQKEQKYPCFSPHDYCTLRELLLTNRPCLKSTGVQAIIASNIRPILAAETFSLNSLKSFIVELGCIDSLLFIDLRWLILDKLIRIEEMSKFESNLDFENNVLGWCGIALACVRYHSCTSVESMLLLRAQVSHWMLALSCRIRGLTFDSAIVLRASEYALKACLSIFLVSDAVLEHDTPREKSLFNLHCSSRISPSLCKALSTENGECCVDFIHCLSAEEAIHCARAISILMKFMPFQFPENLKSEAQSIIVSFMKVTEAQCQIGNEESSKKSREQVTQKKLLRKAKRFLRDVA
jgi:hypothetical protein